MKQPLSAHEAGPSRAAAFVGRRPAQPVAAWEHSPRMRSQRQSIAANFGAPAAAGRAVAQRFLDVRNDAYFAHAADDEFIWRDDDRELFSDYQHFLADIGRTKPHLDALNDELLEQPRMLSAQLGRQETGPLLRLVEGARAEDFLDIVRQGIRFEDWVDAGHGVQTHRIQWYLLRREFGAQVDEMYAMSAEPIFEVLGNYGTSLWDLVVDSTAPNGPHDFTKPERLQTYLLQTYVPPAQGLLARIRRLRQGGASPLRAALSAEGAEFEQRRDAMRAAAPQKVQAEKPGPVENEHGIWSGWKPSGQGANRVWTAAIVKPSLAVEWQESAHAL